VIKHVINDNGGTALAGDFSMSTGGTDASPADGFAGEEVPGTVVLLDAGSYNVTETGPSGYTASFSADCAGTIGIGETKTCIVTNDDFLISAVTDSSLCTFDVNEDVLFPGDQFRLNFTMDPANPGKWILNSTNPGQFYYNVFNYDDPGDPVSLTIQIPFPFLTRGSNPIQVHGEFTIADLGEGEYCFEPLDDLTNAFEIETTDDSDLSPSGAPIITFADYNPDQLGSVAEVTVSGLMPSTGQMYITIHLDYGFKKMGGWMKGTTPDDNSAERAADATFPAWDIQHPQDYQFWVLGDLSNFQTVESINRFKRDPGFAGVVSQITPYGEEPLPGVLVQIWGPTGNLVGTTITDEDGVYLFVYKHTGKAATYMIRLPAYGVQQTAVVKSNGWAIVNFTITVP
jgi:hypothetical protein